jgi:hypothetical protein
MMAIATARRTHQDAIAYFHHTSIRIDRQRLKSLWGSGPLPRRRFGGILWPPREAKCRAKFQEDGCKMQTS